MRYLLAFLIMTLFGELQATPVIESYTANNTGGNEADSLGLTKPSGVSVGDLLLVIVGCDDDLAIDVWNTTIDTESGWTKFIAAGNSTSDSKMGAYWRIATGTDAATVWPYMDQNAPDEIFGWYFRISGHDGTTPIDVTGSATLGSGTSGIAAEVTTTQGDCLAFYVNAFDGGDAVAFSVSGTGWSEYDEEYSGTGSADACGSIGTKTVASEGLTGDATISWTPSDGYVTIQFAIAPGAAPPAASGQYISVTED
jgi:hypothetical protein